MTVRLFVNDFEIELVHRPAETLSFERRSRLSAGLTSVAREAFRSDGITQSQVIRHSIETTMVAYVHRAGAPVGFASAALLELSQGPLASLAASRCETRASQRRCRREDGQVET